MTIRSQKISAARKPLAMRLLLAPFTLVSLGRDYLHAYSALQKFRAQEPHRLTDIGLTQEEADKMTITDFLPRPKR